MINLFWPSYDGKAIKKLMGELFPDDMSNRWIGQGEKVDEFERTFGDKFGYDYCVSLNSGTSALELAYHLIGIKKGDEVLTPVLTCTATNIPLKRLKAKIKFVDVNKNLTIDYKDLKQKANKQTKAIVAVTLGGLPIDTKVFKLAKKLGIPVVIDAAQSVGVGEKHGDYVCYSFQAIKHFTTGDGGMLVVRKEEEYNRAKKLRWFGIDREAKKKNNWQPYKQREMTMDILEPGFKYHMNDISAGIGLIALEKSDKWLVYREVLSSYYRRKLKCKTISGGAYWLFGILVKNRDEVAQFLNENGIETNMAHLRNDIFKIFGGKRQELKNMDKIESQYLYIPFHLLIDKEKAKFICQKINQIAIG
ncbi:aminotransferase class V-fold PLP-dependent enzyme [Candidatus Dojkabacteria bacterium]|jgi:dTDP-4-amino-4,6-dideoxygalactose transaminase|nr:aminotransferase class V-fold PLP-dependent enzyme [Candidatus Dojkabacteria bacterium]